MNTNNQSRKGSFMGVALAILVKGVKLLKAVKLIKPLVTILSMMGSLLAYSAAYGVYFAIGLVGMLFVHEMGHVIALKRKGYAASAPVFIPMLGAVIFAPQIHSRDDEAYVGVAGPVVGGMAALMLCIYCWMIPDHHAILAIIAFVAVILNLFNMLPLRPLDGGRVLHAVTPYGRVLGFTMLLFLTVALKDPGLLLVWIIILSDWEMNLRVKTYVVSIVFLIMATLLFMNLGTPHQVWSIVVDVILGLIWTLLLWARYAYARSKRGKELEDDDESLMSAFRNDRDEIARLPKMIRIKWLATYLVVTAVLIAAMFAQIGILDRHHRELSRPKASKADPARVRSFLLLVQKFQVFKPVNLVKLLTGLSGVFSNVRVNHNNWLTNLEFSRET